MLPQPSPCFPLMWCTFPPFWFLALHVILLCRGMWADVVCTTPHWSFKCACMDWLCLHLPLIFSLWKLYAWKMDVPCPGMRVGRPLGPNWVQRRPGPFREASQDHSPVQTFSSKSECLFLEGTEIWGRLLLQQMLTITKDFKMREVTHETGKGNATQINYIV